jgi:predicted dehydrogenase
MIDFNFHQIMSWQRAKTMLEANAIGALRHVTVHWHVESRTLQLRMRNWKTQGDEGAACWAISLVIVSITSNGSAGRLPDYRRVSPACRMTPMETTVAMAITFQAGPLCSLSMSCASYLGTGHRIEFFGTDGILVLANPGADYMRGFELFTPSGRCRRSNASRSAIQSMRNILMAASRRCRGSSGAL